MKTFSVQSMPNGFEIEYPSLAYWIRAGIGFTIGVGITGICWTILLFTLFAALGITGGILGDIARQPQSHSLPRR